MVDNNCNEVRVRFTPEQKERDICVVGGRVICENGIFLIHGENGACFMIPKEAVSFVACGPRNSIKAEIDDSNPVNKKAIYDLRKEAEE